MNAFSRKPKLTPKQFYADRIWAATTNPPQVFCDVGSEVYRYDYSKGMTSEELLSASCWSDKGRLCRDFWSFFCDRKHENGVFHNNVLELQGPTIKEYKK